MMVSAASPESSPSPTSSEEAPPGGGDAGASAAAVDPQQMTARQRQWLEANRDVFDKLIGLFKERGRDENRKLIAYSKQWPSLAEGVFYRLDELSRQAVNSPKDQAKLRTLLKTLRNIHEEFGRYKVIAKKFESTDEADWEGLVAQNHEYMQAPFFEYWERRLAQQQLELEEEKEEDEEAAEKTAEQYAQRNNAMLARVAALVSALQKAAADEETLQDAGQRFNELLENINSLEEADREIDALQKAGKLDPAMMLTMAKAYSGVKESPYVQEEVKDIMAHLYFKSKEAAARDQPSEVRILKHLLTMDDTMERMEALEMSFEPPSSSETSSADEDLLTTTPPDLLKYVDGVLAAFDTQKEGNNLLGQTAQLMDPAVINRLRDLQATIRKRYM